jgi:hypothetical protein
MIDCRLRCRHRPAMRKGTRPRCSSLLMSQAIRDSGIPREEIFLTTKFFPSEHGVEAVRPGVNVCWR